MKLATLFSFTAVVLLLFGAGFVLVPGPLFALYGVELNSAGVMLATVAGAAVFALGTLALYARTRLEGDVARIAVRTLCSPSSSSRQS